MGLDINPDYFPSNRDRSLKGIEAFGKDVIDATIEFCPVYKPNFAFYERYGSRGYSILEKLVDYINGRALVVADAKRGDIGNTSRQYAKAVLHTMGCDAITISPYMGRDVVEAFIDDYKKGIFILCITSNPSASELQNDKNDSIPLYHKIVKIANELNNNNNIGLVIGATQSKLMETIRKKTMDLPWLIPGVGAQGGDLNKAVSISNHGGIGIINISRGILYAGSGSIDDILDAAKNYNEKIREIICNPQVC